MSAYRTAAVIAAAIAIGAGGYTVGHATGQPAAEPSYSQAWAQCRAHDTYDHCVEWTADAVAIGAVQAPAAQGQS